MPEFALVRTAEFSVDDFSSENADAEDEATCIAGATTDLPNSSDW